MKTKYLLAYMDMAVRFGQTSDAGRSQVGCLLVKDGGGGVISEGVNGQPPKWPTEICEDDKGKTLPTVRHAEIAALDKMINKTETAKGSIAFVSLSPCYDCAIKLVGAGIKHVYFREEYRCQKGINYLLANGVFVTQISEFGNIRDL